MPLISTLEATQKLGLQKTATVCDLLHAGYLSGQYVHKRKIEIDGESVDRLLAKVQPVQSVKVAPEPVSTVTPEDTAGHDDFANPPAAVVKP